MIRKVLLMVITAFAVVTISNTKVKASTLITGPDIIYKDAKKNFTVNEMLDLYSSENNELEIISEDYTGYGDVPGIYNLTIGIKNTFSTRNVEIHVKQKISDKAFAASQTNNTYQIYTTKSQVLEVREIVKVIERISSLQIFSQSGIKIHNDTYTENSQSPGLYLYEFTIVSPNGTQKTYPVDIYVRNEINFNPDYTFENPNNFASIFKTTIIVLILGIISYLVYLFFSKKNKRKGKRYS